MWYAVQTPTGREAEMAEKLNRVYSGESDKPCFVLSKERSWRMGGIYHIGVEPMFPGYIFVDTDDAGELEQKIGILAGSAKLPLDEKAVPLEKAEEDFLKRLLREDPLEKAANMQWTIDTPKEPVEIPEDCCITGTRTLPCGYEEILIFARKRNPMNHMAVMMRRDAVLAVGNYRAVKGAEDYELWVRMLQAGYRAENLPDVLVYARTGNGMMQRRGGLAYARENIRLQTHFYKSGFLTFPEYISNCAVRVAASILPVGIRGYLYQKKLRERMHA